MKITTASHLDHGLTEAQVNYILDKFKDREAFFIETIYLPVELGSVMCGLHGPIVGDMPVPDDEVAFVMRPPRTYLSRMCSRPSRQVQGVTVIAGPHEGDPCILYTVFGGPAAPREPRDPSLPEEQRDASIAFWAQHALSLDSLGYADDAYADGDAVKVLKDAGCFQSTITKDGTTRWGWWLKGYYLGMRPTDALAKMREGEDE